MSERLEFLAVAFLFAVQLAGLACMVLTRICTDGRGQVFCQRLFNLSLLLVGMTAIAAICLRGHGGFSCGVTLAVMAVGATLDLRRTKKAPAF